MSYFGEICKSIHEIWDLSVLYMDTYIHVTDPSVKLSELLYRLSTTVINFYKKRNVKSLLIIYKVEA